MICTIKRNDALRTTHHVHAPRLIFKVSNIVLQSPHMIQSKIWEVWEGGSRLEIARECLIHIEGLIILDHHHTILPILLMLSLVAGHLPSAKDFIFEFPIFLNPIFFYLCKQQGHWDLSSRAFRFWVRFRIMGGLYTFKSSVMMLSIVFYGLVYTFIIPFLAY